MRGFIRKIRAARAAFTLMEVNLAVFIMAVGVLAMTSLYPLGFRESQQSRDDVRAAIVANEVLGQLTAALSSRNLTWKEWNDAIGAAVNVTPRGWFEYLEEKNDYDEDGVKIYGVKSQNAVASLANGAFNKLAELNGDIQNPFGDKTYAYGLVVQWGKRLEASGSASSSESPDHSRVSISFRMARRVGALMAAPIYYTEIHFQGDQADGGDRK